MTTRPRALPDRVARSARARVRRAQGSAIRSRSPSSIDLPRSPVHGTAGRRPAANADRCVARRQRISSSRRVAVAALVGLSSALAPTASAQVALAIDGYGLAGPSSATSGGTLYGTKQGQIHVVDADTGAWSILAVGISLQPYDPEDLEYSDYLQLITAYPWLNTPSPTVAETLGSASHPDSIVGLVDPVDLTSAGATALLVRPQDLASQVRGCIDPQAPNPEKIKSLGQAILLGETGVTWRSQYPTWGGVSMEAYWLPAYARTISGQEDFTHVHWFRLMESACVTAVGYEETIAFTRSADVVVAASLGLYLHVQAVTLQGHPPSAPTADPETTPGLVNVTPSTLPRFKVSLPITIAIPYTPPFLPGQYVPYEPGVLNITAAPGAMMVVAVGVTTSATHAVFPAGPKEVKTPIYRFLKGGPMAFFVVPIEATAGAVEFVDLVGEDESELMPIDSFPYAPPEELQSTNDDKLGPG